MEGIVGNKENAHESMGTPGISMRSNVRSQKKNFRHQSQGGARGKAREAFYSCALAALVLLWSEEKPRDGSRMGNGEEQGTSLKHE